MLKRSRGPVRAFWLRFIAARLKGTRQRLRDADNLPQKGWTSPRVTRTLGDDATRLPVFCIQGLTGLETEGWPWASDHRLRGGMRWRPANRWLLTCSFRPAIVRQSLPSRWQGWRPSRTRI